MPSAPVMVEKMSAIRLDALLALAFPLFGPSTSESGPQAGLTDSLAYQ